MNQNYSITNKKPVFVSLAVLYFEDKFLVQLRDNIPGIVYPGHWGLFGGHIEADETPEEALKRELIEEIGYSVDQLTPFRIYKEDHRIVNIFSSPLNIPIEQIILGEGSDFALVTAEVILKGEYYSDVVGGSFPFVPTAVKVLLDFLAS
jgi:8-oxo-dGTP diphosphatase